MTLGFGSKIVTTVLNNMILMLTYEGIQDMVKKSLVFLTTSKSKEVAVV